MPESKTSLSQMLYDLRRIAQHREILTDKKINAIYNTLKKDLRSFLGESYEEYADTDGRLYMSYLDGQRKRAWFLNEIVKSVDNIEPLLQKEVSELINTVYEKCYSGMADAVKKADTRVKLETVSKDISVQPNVLKRVVNNNISRLTLTHVMEKHRAEIIYQLQQELSIGLMNGDRYETMAKRITERVNVSETKAKNIVRTETHRNTESGFLDCGEYIQDKLGDSGLIYAVTWRTMKDESVRPNYRRKTKRGWKSGKNKNGANHVQMEGQTVKAGELFDLGDGVKAKAPGKSGVAAHDCNCRCFLEYNLMTAEEFEKATGKMVANDGNTLNINVSDRAMQNYKPVEIDLNNQNTFKRKSGPVTVSRLSNTNNSIYISSNARIKPKQQHELDKNITAVLDMLNVKDKSVQPIVAVLTDGEMANNAVAAYNPIQNVVYVRQALLDYDKLPALQEQLACPNNKYSTLLHEYIHWFDAQRYRTKNGDFNNADDYNKYIVKLNKKCKKNLDKNGIKVYNASAISKYAGDKYVDESYYETYTEYRVVKILGG